MKKKKTYTISALGMENTPIIKLTGKWLLDNGFNIGDKLQFIQSKNMIILVKN